MTALIIFTHHSTHDQSQVDTYQSLVRDTFAGHPIKVLAAGAPQQLEGAQAKRVVVLEFPTLQEARQWYDSPAYAAARQHRLKGSEFSAVLVEGV